MTAESEEMASEMMKTKENYPEYLIVRQCESWKKNDFIYIIYLEFYIIIPAYFRFEFNRFDLTIAQ